MQTKTTLTLMVVITVLKVEKSESNSQLKDKVNEPKKSCNHCFKGRKI